MDNFIDAIEKFSKSIITQNVNTCMPGIIEKYDSSTKKATITPCISKMFSDGTTQKYKPIENVPIVWMRTNKSIIKTPLDKGDYVLLLFCQHDIGSFLSNNNIDPDSDRTFDITDAIAIPGLFSFTNISKDSGLNDDLEICYDESKIVIKKNGNIEIGKNTFLKLINENFKNIFNNHVHNFIGAPSGTYSTSIPASITLTSYPAPTPVVSPALYGSAIGNSDMTSILKAE